MPRRCSTLPAAVALAAALSLSLAACGGGATQQTPSTSPAGGTSGGTPGAPSAPSASPGESTGEGAGQGADEEPRRVYTQEQYDEALAQVQELPLEMLAGQLIVTHYTGQTPQAVADLVRREHLGGVITFAENVPPEDSRVATLRRTHELIQAAMKADGRDWPAMIGVDQEGGPVARLAAPLTELGPAMSLGAIADESERERLAQAAATASGAELRALGYTMVFAPDADVTIGAQDPTIGVRSPGSDPQAVAGVVSALGRGYTQAGILSSPKHFPGHGSLTTDSHVGLPVQERSLADLEQGDLVPFARAAAEGAPMIMVGHIAVPELDSLPASLSPKVIDGLLRTNLGYEGLVVTDALNMGAIVERFGVEKVAVMAVQAGVDALLMPTDPVLARDAIVAAVEAGTLERSRLEASAARIVATLRAGVGEQPGVGVVGAPEHQAVAAEIAQRAVTVVGGQCRVNVGETVAVTGGTETDRARFARAAQAAGLGIGAGGTTVALADGASYNAGSPGAVQDPSAAATPQAPAGDVVVALDVPYALAGLREGQTGVATFGRTAAHFTALVDVLTGKAEAQGALPVAVGAHEVGSGC